MGYREDKRMYSLMERTMLLAVLGMAAYRDWREKNIYLYMPIMAGIVGLILHLIYREHTLMELLLGAGLGGIMILIALVSRESIGIGDGVMLMVSGIFLGIWKNLELLLTALVLVGVAALFLIVVKKKRRDYRVPFLPFLLVAYLFQLA